MFMACFTDSKQSAGRKRHQRPLRLFFFSFVIMVLAVISRTALSFHHYYSTTTRIRSPSFPTQRIQQSLQRKQANGIQSRTDRTFLSSISTPEITPLSAAESSKNNVTKSSDQRQKRPSSTTASPPIVLPDNNNNIQTWLDVELPEGRCVGVVVKNEDDCFPSNDNIRNSQFAWLKAVYHPAEIEYAMQLKASRTSFWLGRLALRTALNFPDYPLLKDAYGRPILHHQNNMLGSISHKQNRGIALVTSNKEVFPPNLAGIGVDLELTSRPGRPSIAKRILTENERSELGTVDLPSITTTEQEVLLRFSLKEAIYKAAHPLLNQYVGFQEADVTPHPNGTATCQWLLQENATLPDDKIAKLTAHWQRITTKEYDFFLTTASAYTASNKRMR